MGVWSDSQRSCSADGAYSPTDGAPVVPSQGLQCEETDVHSGGKEEVGILRGGEL